jgi:hypothetical protein
MMTIVDGHKNITAVQKAELEIKKEHSKYDDVTPLQ